MERMSDILEGKSEVENRDHPPAEETQVSPAAAAADTDGTAAPAAAAAAAKEAPSSSSSSSSKKKKNSAAAAAAAAAAQDDGPASPASPAEPVSSPAAGGPSTQQQYQQRPKRGTLVRFTDSTGAEHQREAASTSNLNAAATTAAPAAAAAASSTTDANTAHDGSFTTTFARRVRGESLKKRGTATTSGSDSLSKDLLSDPSNATPTQVRAGDDKTPLMAKKQQGGAAAGAGGDEDIPNYVPRTKGLHTHHYSEGELKKMNGYESVDTWEPVTDLYLEHIEERRGERRYLAWIIYCVVGLAIGFWAIIVFHSIDQLGEVKMKATARLVHDSGAGVAFIVWLLWSTFAGFCATMTCVFYPNGSGSGVPEVMAQLNGIDMPEQVKAMVIFAKTVSVIFAVHTGMPVGAEGPMIQFGSIIGGLVSAGRTGSKRLDEWLRPIYRTFQNPKDQRDFVTAGAAAGVTSVFASPIGGFLFVMEELASFMNPKVAWMTFTSCLCCYLFVQIGGTYLEGWQPAEVEGGGVDVFNMNPNAVTLFAQNIDPRQYVPVTVLAILPAAAVGIAMGLWAAGFIHLHLTIVQKWRWVYVNKSMVRKVIEPVALSALFACIWFGLSASLPCAPIPPGFTPEQYVNGGDTDEAAGGGGAGDNTTAGNATAQLMARVAKEASSSGLLTGGFYVRDDSHAADSSSAAPPRPFVSASNWHYGVRSKLSTFLPSSGKAHPIFGDLFSASHHRPRRVVHIKQQQQQQQNEGNTENVAAASGGGEEKRSADTLESRTTGHSVGNHSAVEAYYGGLRLHTAFCAENKKGEMPTHFSTFASLSMTGAYNTIRLGFSRHTMELLDIGQVALYWVIYSAGACYCAGMYMASGIVIPTLVIGALGGRLIGCRLVAPWSDPGVMALMGAAAFFSGLSRLTISLVVIMIEISDDLSNVGVMMICVIIAKFCADALSHSLYHEQLQIRGVPFLDFDTQVHNLDKHCVADLMTPDPLSLPIVCSVQLLQKAAKSKYSGFPVVRRGVSAEDMACTKDFLRRSDLVTRAQQGAAAAAAAAGGGGGGGGESKRRVGGKLLKTKADDFTFLGTITREMCGRLLWHLYVSESTHGTMEPPIPSYYDLLEIDDFYTEHVSEKVGVLSTVDGAKFWLPPETATFRDRLIDLSPFINGSAFFVNAEMAVSRAYNLFRSMSLRHLAVVDTGNQLIGVVGRKNLLGHFMNEGIKSKEDTIWRELGREES